jgi:PKD repeat protein
MGEVSRCAPRHSLRSMGIAAQASPLKSCPSGMRPLFRILICCLAFIPVHAAPDPSTSNPGFTCFTPAPPTRLLLEDWARRRAQPAAESTLGSKALLLVRVDFSDLPGAPFTPAQGTNLLGDLNDFFAAMSSGRMRFHPPGGGSDFTPVLRMPLPASIYGLLNPAQLRADAFNAAIAAGFDPADYNLDVICTGNVPGYGFTGQAYVGLRGAWMKNAFSHAGPIAHELGHNLGLNHANLWDTSGADVIGPGREIEYGDTSDTMSLSTGYSRHFNARSKHLLGWLDDTDLAQPSVSTVVRLLPHDLPPSTPGPRAMRIARGTRTNYWMGFRQLHTNAPVSAVGLGIRWADPTNRPTLFLDTTPGSAAGVSDGFLRPGHTFSDPLLDVHVTPIGTVGTPVEALDVDIRFGPFPGDRPPVATLTPPPATVPAGTPVTFTVTASDPDDDPLAYGWDFGDETVLPNQPSITRTFASPGHVMARCIVSDRRGGTTSVQARIRVGTTTGSDIGGLILRQGQPLDGVTLSVSGNPVAHTAQDGRFLVPGLNNGTRLIRPHRDGHVFLPRQREVTVTDADFDGADFTTFAIGDLEPVELSPAAGTWRFLDNGSDPGPAWTTDTFNDAAWRSGPAPLGYGFADLATTVSFGPNPNGKWITTFFRRNFTV